MELKIPENHYRNDLLNLIELYPNKTWCGYWISFNPNITWKIIQKNPIDFYSIS